MVNINSFWVSNRLSEINWLSILSFLKHGHTFTLYTYERNLNFPAHLNFDGLILKDAREIMPESEIYYYKNMMGGNPHFKFGGIAERLKAEMLYQLGGWHVDLDVVCLRPFDLVDEYVLRPHPINGKLTGVVANIIKAPKHSEMAKRYVEWTKQINENNRDWEKSFRGLVQIVSDLNLQKYIVDEEVLGYDDPIFWKMTKKETGKLSVEYEVSLYAIHYCNAMQEPYEIGSYYHSLLKQYNLI